MIGLVGNSTFIKTIVFVYDQIVSRGIVTLLVRLAFPVIVESHCCPSVPLFDMPSVFFHAAAKTM